MKQITLQNMKIRNFKGIKEYELFTDGRSVNIFGENGSGKTTLYDAFLWCLFGKDSSGQGDNKFDWKPLNKENEEIHHLETEVSVTLLLDNKEKELSRMISEDWVRKRGSIVEEFNGHSTKFKVDGISIKKKEYTDVLAKIIDDDTFKMLTNVDYFPEKLDWKKRREVLIYMVGDVSDQDVIESNDDLRDVPNILDGKSVDDRLKQLKQKMREINQNIKSLPQRIDEVDRSLPDLSHLDKEKLESELSDVKETIQKVEEEIASFSNGSHVTNLRSELQTKVAELQTAKSNYQLKQNESIEGIQEEKQQLYTQAMDADNELKEAERKLKDYERDLQAHSDDIDHIENQKAELREQFIKLRDETFPEFDEHKTTCVLCGQDYPEEKQLEMQDNYEKEKAAFNQEKASKLEKINEKGKAYNAEIEEIKQALERNQQLTDETQDKIQSLTRKRDELKDQYESVRKKIEDIKNQEDPFEDSPEYGSLNAQVEKLKMDIKSLQESADEQLQYKKEKLQEYQSQRDEIADKLYQFKLAEKQEARKQELIDEEGKLGIEYGSLEQQLQTLEEFIRSKVNLLTETINEKFSIVKFKLFSTNINGGLEEVCEPTVNGANYSTGLNNAARINAGLDIINTLMDHYQIKVPIFIDNAESINDILDINTQQITLSVSKHKTLRVEEV